MGAKPSERPFATESVNINGLEYDAPIGTNLTTVNELRDFWYDETTNWAKRRAQFAHPKWWWIFAPLAYDVKKDGPIPWKSIFERLLSHSKDEAEVDYRKVRRQFDKNSANRVLWYGGTFWTLLCSLYLAVEFDKYLTLIGIWSFGMLLAFSHVWFSNISSRGRRVSLTIVSILVGAVMIYAPTFLASEDLLGHHRSSSIAILIMFMSGIGDLGRKHLVLLGSALSFVMLAHEVLPLSPMTFGEMWLLALRLSSIAFATLIAIAVSYRRSKSNRIVHCYDREVIALSCFAQFAPPLDRADSAIDGLGN